MDWALSKPRYPDFKWGWSATEGEVVWDVRGPGDGLPSHDQQLSTAWGREPGSSAGDLFGNAEYVRSPAPEPDVVVIHAFYSAPVPEAVVHWFRAAFPDARVRLAGAE